MYDAADCRQRAAELVKSAFATLDPQEQLRLLGIAGYWQAKALRTEAGVLSSISPLAGGEG